MNTQIKNQIRKIIKNPGSHLGVVKRIITETNLDVNFKDYVAFTELELMKKANRVKSTIRSSVRFQ